jgi:hypothetical protein
MYMVREVIQAQRGKAPEIVAGFNILDQMFEQAGYTNHFVDPDEQTKALIDLFNTVGRSGHREIYEVIQ